MTAMAIWRKWSHDERATCRETAFYNDAFVSRLVKFDILRRKNYQQTGIKRAPNAQGPAASGNCHPSAMFYLAQFLSDSFQYDTQAIFIHISNNFNIFISYQQRAVLSLDFFLTILLSNMMWPILQQKHTGIIFFHENIPTVAHTICSNSPACIYTYIYIYMYIKI